MINRPVCIENDNFQDVWLAVVRRLMISHWEIFNLVIQVRNPRSYNKAFHEKVDAFANSQGILGPKHVAYTIFPHSLYERKGDAPSLFEAYNKSRGLFDRIKSRWGTYFRRMSCYEGAAGTVNQLDNIIKAIREREKLSKAAYTIVIQKPGGETVRPLGGPCLNYIAVQAQQGQDNQPSTIGLLAVYRNHEFLERAYGNYWGLCNLLMFLAKEVNAEPGPLTCISSHAYVANKKTELKQLVEGF